MNVDVTENTDGVSFAKRVVEEKELLFLQFVDPHGS